MAINRKRNNEVEGPSAPDRIDELIRENFTLQNLADLFKKAYYEARAEFTDEVEASKEFTLDLSVGYKHECGTVMIKKKDSKKVDLDVIRDLINSGEIELNQLWANISISTTDLDKAIGKKLFDKAVTVTEGEQLEFKANSEFKNALKESMGEIRDSKPKPKVKETPKPKITPKKKIKASADDDLDSILGSTPKPRKKK